MNGSDAPDSNPTGASSAVGETILRRFRVERVLGRGGMGDVMLAHDTLLNRRVALKRLRSDGAGSGSRRSAVLKEARRASQITDRRIAAIYDVLDLDEDVLIVMEYVDGATLRARMSAPLPVAEFWDLSAQCVEAVAAAHAHGLIHRDIKPENLMLTGGGLIKILDFGIARRPDAPQGAGPTGEGTTATTLTSGGREAVIAGTPQYMAPEAHYGGRLDQRTDIFSLGTVFYELLTGHHPFAASTYQDILERVMRVTPPPAGELNPEVGPALSGVIARMLSKDPDHRQASCEEVLRELTAAREREGPGSGPVVFTAPSVPAHRPWRTLKSRRVLVTCLVLAAVGTAWVAWRGSAARALPGDRNVGLLAPVTIDATPEFASFALGAIDLLSARLQRHQVEPGVQTASFQEAIDQDIRSAVDARKIQGVNLALVPTLEQGTDTFRARLELWNTERGKVIAVRSFESAAARPFDLLDRLYAEAADLLGLKPAPGDPGYGIRGAGTLRFLLQGIGRMRSATTEPEAARAVDDLELARRAEPDAAVALAWLSAAQRRRFALGGDPALLDRAQASAREAIALDSSRAEAYRQLGLVLLLQKDAPGAVAAFARAFQLNPTDDEIPSRLGSAYRRVGQPDREIQTYAAVIAARPHCWQPYWWLANTRFRRGEVGEAIVAYREMVRRAPDYYRSYSNLAAVLVLEGDYAAAIDTLKRSLALRPTKTAFDNLGTAYFNSDRVDDAVGAYNQAFQFGFAEYDSWLNLGDAHFFLHDRKDQAVEAYAQAIRLGREQLATRAAQGRSFDVMIPANLATVFPKLGQPDSARVYLRWALSADSANVMVQACAALTYWQLAEPGEAVRWLDKAVQGGYPAAWLRDSRVFRAWREQEDFRAILARAEAGTRPGASPN